VVDDPSLADQTHWTVTKLCGRLREEKNITKHGHELNDKLFNSIRALLKRRETIRSVCKTHSE